MAAREAILRIRADADRAIRSVKKYGASFSPIRGATGAAARGVRALNAAVGRLTGGLLGSRAGLLSLVGAGVGIYGIRRALLTAAEAAESFELSMAKVATITDQNRQQTARLSGEVLRLSRELGTAPTETAAGVYQAISAGITDLGEALQFLRPVTKLSIAGFADQATVVKTVSTIMSAYRIEVGRTAEVTDKLFLTTQKGKIEIPELAAGLGQVVGVASQAGVELDELLGLLAQVTQTVGPRQAITALQGVIFGIVSPTKEAAEAFEEYEINVSRARIQSEGFGAILADIARKAQGNTDILTRIFPEREAFRAISAFADSRALESLAAQIATFSASAGTTETAFGKIDSTVARLRARLKSTQDIIKVVLGDALTPVIVGITKEMQRLSDRFLEWLITGDGAVTIAEKLTDGFVSAASGAATLANGIVTSFSNVTEFKAGLQRLRIELLATEEGYLKLAKTASLGRIPGLGPLLSDAGLVTSQEEFSRRLQEINDEVIAIGVSMSKDADKIVTAKAFVDDLATAITALSERVKSDASGALADLVERLNEYRLAAERASEGGTVPTAPGGGDGETIAEAYRSGADEADTLEQKQRELNVQAARLGGELTGAFRAARGGVDDLLAYMQEKLIEQGALQLAKAILGAFSSPAAPILGPIGNLFPGGGGNRVASFAGPVGFAPAAAAPIVIVRDAIPTTTVEFIGNDPGGRRALTRYVTQGNREMATR